MFRSMLICLAAALAGLVSLIAFTTTAAGQHQRGTIMQWSVDGLPRGALVFTPHAKQSADKHPLVIAFHGHGGDMLRSSVRMHIQTLWPEAIVVYPQGLSTSTADGYGGVEDGLAGESG